MSALDELRPLLGRLRASCADGDGEIATALERLETKGCLTSRMGDPTDARGGKPRRYEMPRTLVQLYEAKQLGRKTGIGIYDYSGEKPTPTR